MTSDEIDSTDTEGDGYTDTDSGASKMTINVKGMWNAAENPHASPLNIRNGQELSNVYIYISGTLAFYAAKMKITSVNVNIPVRNGVMLDFQMTNKGAFSYPGS